MTQHTAGYCVLVISYSLVFKRIYNAQLILVTRSKGSVKIKPDENPSRTWTASHGHS